MPDVNAYDAQIGNIFRALKAAEAAHPDSPQLATLHTNLLRGAQMLAADHGTVIPGPLDGEPK